MKEARGIRNCNPLNIRKGAQWQGMREVQTDPSFVQFKTMQYGIRAAFKLMRNHITGFDGSRPCRNTLAKLINVWAPPSENATQKYVDFVSQSVGIGAWEILNPDDAPTMCRIARAMAFVETGQWLDADLFASSWFII